MAGELAEISDKMKADMAAIVTKPAAIQKEYVPEANDAPIVKTAKTSLLPASLFCVVSVSKFHFIGVPVPGSTAQTVPIAPSSHATALNTTNTAVEFKVLIEQMREQIQNIE